MVLLTTKKKKEVSIFIQIWYIYSFEMLFKNKSKKKKLCIEMTGAWYFYRKIFIKLLKLTNLERNQHFEKSSYMKNNNEKIFEIILVSTIRKKKFEM